ncbi:N-acetylmuramoyl-L-alanine amidase [Bacillus cereus group sp. BfR-BA-01383]|uniref:N-acetylmuramoyl-L-alanine amidase n=1 Tax=Bacillus cereus group sp. BfR-BA-01383 TaxID=2920327 RepID=UPI001F58CF9A|nr:N-acetylmuramoyl-L-alanine amidase [Bacillus cereus group sp. BfR-BA-01383]
MARYSLHGGHNSIVQGANYGNRKEHIMDRQVKDAVVTKLRELGHTVYDDTDEVGTTQAQNLSNIVAKTNSHDVDLVISFHLNSYDTNANGVEVLYYDQQALSAKIASQLSTDVGWSNRGAKERKDLYVLANTKAPAILIELGFIDNESDMAKWNVDKISNSIVYALTGQSGGTTPPSKQNIIQSGAFSPYEAPEAMQALNSVKMTAKFILQSDGLTYFISDPTSDAQLNGMKGWLDRKGWWYEVK